MEDFIDPLIGPRPLSWKMVFYYLVICAQFRISWVSCFITQSKPFSPHRLMYSGLSSDTLSIFNSLSRCNISSSCWPTPHIHQSRRNWRAWIDRTQPKSHRWSANTRWTSALAIRPSLRLRLSTQATDSLISGRWRLLGRLFVQLIVLAFHDQRRVVSNWYSKERLWGGKGLL